MAHSILAQMLGRYIVEARKDINMSQAVLAQQVKCSAQFLGKIEKGDALPPELILIRCVRILNLDSKKLRKIYRIASDSNVDSLISKARSIDMSKKRESKCS